MPGGRRQGRPPATSSAPGPRCNRFCPSARGARPPGAVPERSFYKDTGRATYVAITDTEALEGFRLLSETEGIIPALEPSHAIAYVAKFAPTLPKDTVILLGLSGRGDKDINTVIAAL